MLVNAAKPLSYRQVLLGATILTSTVMTYIASSPPRANPSSASSVTAATDFLTRYKITSQHSTKVALVPLWAYSLHASLLAALYPHNIPPRLLGHARANSFNTDLITWSAATVVPLVLLFGVAFPLRLLSYSTLAHNFTFALARPDRLTTTEGLYRYVQHPSYTGLVMVVACNALLLGRSDGVLACWVNPQGGRWGGYAVARRVMWGLIPGVLVAMCAAMWVRVLQEEEMLKAAFGDEWERWHAATCRFVPWVF